MPHGDSGPAPARGRIPPRDATLGEDASRVRARPAPVNNATRNDIALAIVRRRGFRFVPAATTPFMVRRDDALDAILSPE